MCQRCFDLWSSLKDVDRPCRRAGCKGTGRQAGAQLARLVRGKSADPYPRYCGECEKELGDLEDRRSLSHGRLPGNLHLEQGTAARGWRAPKFKEPPPSKPRLTLSRLPRLAAAMPCLPRRSCDRCSVPQPQQARPPCPESTHAPAPRHPLLLPRIDRQGKKTGVGASRSRRTALLGLR